MHTQSHLFKVNLYAFRDTCASRVLRVPLRLVEVNISSQRWPEHPKFKNKNKKLIHAHYQYTSSILHTL